MKSERSARRLGACPPRRSTESRLFSAIPPSSRSFFPAGPQTRVLARPATASTGWMRRVSTRIEARVRIVDVWVDVAARSGASGEVARPHCPFDAPWEANHLGHCRCAGEALRLLQGRSAARVASRRPRRVRASTCGRRYPTMPRDLRPRLGRSHPRPPRSIAAARDASAPISFKFAPLASCDDVFRTRRSELVL